MFFEDILPSGAVISVNVRRYFDTKTSQLGTKIEVDALKDVGYTFNVTNLDYFLKLLKEKQVKDFRLTFNSTLTNDISEFQFRILMTSVISIGFSFVLYLVFKQLRKNLRSMSKNERFDEKDSNFMKRLKNDAMMKGTKNKIMFSDVAGMDEAKKEIMEFVDFLKNSSKYTNLGAKIPRGALLTGSPGTGKTLLAKACANEAKVPFISISASEFVEIFVGVGASRMRTLFTVAKENSPCIIFIDEIDAIGKKRSSGVGGGNEERENTLNQLLVEMDGFGTKNNIVIFAATNMKDSLDPALLRPGRFDRLIDVPLPDIDARKKIFEIHLKKITLNPVKNLHEYAKRLATLTPGFSGADIENICNEAAIISARADKEHVSAEQFEEAVERVIGGLEKKMRTDMEMKRTVAIHECGHGVVSWFLKGGLPLLKLTIIPRSKGSLGFAQYLPNENFLDTKQELLDRICSVLAGRIAEEELIGKITTGASDDLQKVDQLAHSIVTTFGMSDSLGPVQFHQSKYGMASYSQETSYKIDLEKLSIIQECTEKTRKLIREKKESIVELSNLLIAKETLTFAEIRAVLGDRPFPAKGSFKRYLEESVPDVEPENKEPEGPQATAVPLVKDEILWRLKSGL